MQTGPTSFTGPNHVEPGGPGRQAARSNRENGKTAGNREANNRSGFSEKLEDASRKAADKSNGHDKPEAAKAEQHDSREASHVQEEYTGDEAAECSKEAYESNPDTGDLESGDAAAEVRSEDTQLGDTQPGDTQTGDTVLELLNLLAELLQELRAAAGNANPPGNGNPADTGTRIPGVLNQIDRFMAGKIRQLLQVLRQVDMMGELPPALEDLKNVIKLLPGREQEMPSGEFLNRPAERVMNSLENRINALENHLRALNSHGEVQKGSLRAGLNSETRRAANRINIIEGQVNDGRQAQAVNAAANQTSFSADGITGNSPSQAGNTSGMTGSLQDTGENIADSSSSSGETKPAQQVQPPPGSGADAQQNPGQAGIKSAGSTSWMGRMEHAVFNQIIRNARVMTSAAGSEMHIQLKPDFLGRLNLTVSSDNGIITATFNTENYNVKAIIEANLNSLKNALAEQGVKVDQLVVNLAGDRDFSQFRERNAASGKGHGNRHRSVFAAGEDYEAVTAMERRGPQTGNYLNSTVDFLA